MLARRGSFAALCRQFGVHPSTAYKWWARFQAEGRAGLCERSRRPHRSPRQLAPEWVRRLRALRRAHPHWGPRKLAARLRALYPRRRLPAARTLGRWLQRLGLAAVRPCRARKGPRLQGRAPRAAHRPHAVWTMDFKGSLHTGDGTRVEPLTVRDLYSRRILAVRLLRSQATTPVRRALQRLFAREGLPRAIRVDHGAPFAGAGPRGWSRLSVWWRRLGIEVEFTRRAAPQDNAAHEQMHRVYKAEAASPPAHTLAAQQRRSDRWRELYNRVRPHEALGLRPPQSRYRPSPRPLPATLPQWCYPPRWQILRVCAKGCVQWKGRQRTIGRAFAGERVGLRLLRAGVAAVYLGPDLLGHLHADDASLGLRPVQLTSQK